jgi:hypothetical protein
MEALEFYDVIGETLDEFEKTNDKEAAARKFDGIVGSAKVAAINWIWNWMKEENCFDCKTGKIGRRMVTPLYKDTNPDLPLRWPDIAVIDSVYIEPHK